jgi:hypothetical protein
VVEIMDGADRTRTTQTTADGRYRLDGLTPGSFGVRAQYTEYVEHFTRVTLSGDAVQDFRVTRPVVQYFGDLDVQEIPGHQYRFRGSIRNDGDACAQQIRGTVTLTFNQVPVLTSSWTLEPSRILKPQDVATYEFCCLADRYAGQSGIYTGTFEYLGVGC